MLKPYGVLPALITPLKKDGSLNEKALRQMIEYVIEGGVHGIFALGTTAEFYAIGPEAVRDILTIAKEQAAGRVPVYAGANSITTRESIRLVEIATEVGVDAISVLTPMFISPNDEELYAHYRAIAASTDRAIILYNNAPKTGVNLRPALVERLAGIENITGIKDSVGDFTQTIDYIRRTKDKEFSVMMGRDTLIYANLCHGGTGAVAACANVAPKIVSAIYNAWKNGDHAAALEHQMKLTPLRLAFTLGTFPAVIKESLKLLGIDAGPCFAPVSPLKDEERSQLRNILQEMDLLQ